MCFSVLKSRVRGLQSGEDWGEAHAGHPNNRDTGRRRWSGDEVEGKHARDNGAGVRWVVGTPRGPPSSYGLLHLKCEILVESARRILLHFLKIIPLRYVLNFTPMLRGYGGHRF